MFLLLCRSFFPGIPVVARNIAVEDVLLLLFNLLVSMFFLRLAFFRSLILFGFPTITAVSAVTGIPSYYGLPVLLRPCCGMCLAISAAVAAVEVAVIAVPAANSVLLAAAFSDAPLLLMSLI
jgi:hypothetical protein